MTCNVDCHRITGGVSSPSFPPLSPTDLVEGKVVKNMNNGVQSIDRVKVVRESFGVVVMEPRRGHRQSFWIKVIYG
ncbi:hypothetical protein TB1_031354 [Malus domestica]